MTDMHHLNLTKKYNPSAISSVLAVGSYEDVDAYDSETGCRSGQVLTRCRGHSCDWILGADNPGLFVVLGFNAHFRFLVGSMITGEALSTLPLQEISIPYFVLELPSQPEPRIVVSSMSYALYLVDPLEGAILTTAYMPSQPTVTHLVGESNHIWCGGYSSQTFLRGNEGSTFTLHVSALDEERAFQPVRRDIRAHESCIRDISSSLEHGLVASVSLDKTAQIWSKKTYERVAKWNLDDQVNDCVVVDDCHALITGESRGPITVWDLRMFGTPIRSFLLGSGHCASGLGQPPDSHDTLGQYTSPLIQHFQHLTYHIWQLAHSVETR